MSSEGDDWENQLDSDNEQNEESKKIEEAKKKFEDEDTVDPEVVEKQKKEEARKAQEEAEKNGRVKNKKESLDELFEKRQAKLREGGVTQKPAAQAQTEGMSKAAMGIVQEQENEKNLVDQLFGGDDGDFDENGEVKLILGTEAQFKEYGDKVGKVISAGKGKERFKTFFMEVGKNLQTHTDSRTIKKIADHFLAQYNEKLKAEKLQQKGGKKEKKDKAPTLKGGGAKGYEMNNNQAMINDVMGDENDYGDYGDYGEEVFAKEKEETYDFM